MAEPVLLDTCAAIWLMRGDPLSAASRSAIRAAQSSSAGVYVSPMTAWEMGTLSAKGKLHFSLSPQRWFQSLLELPGVRLAELTPEILLASTALPGTPPSDPVDRILAATARVCGFTVITRDRKLLEYARAGHLRAKAC